MVRPRPAAREGVAPDGGARSHDQKADEDEGHDEDEHGNEVHVPAFRRVLTCCHYSLLPNPGLLNAEGDYLWISPGAGADGPERGRWTGKGSGEIDIDSPSVSHRWATVMFSTRPPVAVPTRAQ